MIDNQAYLFTIFVINGVLIGILFDFFRILRKVFKTSDFVTYIEDIIFWILTGIIFIYSMYKFCDGELRIFMIIGIMIGTLIYMLTISQILIKVLTIIINFLKRIIIIPLKIIYNISKKMKKFSKKLIKRGDFLSKRRKI